MGQELHFKLLRKSVDPIMGENFSIESSSMSIKNFKTNGKNMSPRASNFIICAIHSAVSEVIQTIFKFMEIQGQKIRIQKNWKSLVIFHVKDSEGSMMTISEFDPNLRIFDIFLDFQLINDSSRDSYYFSDMQTTPLNKLIYFSKKSESKKFRPKSLNPPYIIYCESYTRTSHWQYDFPDHCWYTTRIYSWQECVTKIQIDTTGKGLGRWNGMIHSAWRSSVQWNIIPVRFRNKYFTRHIKIESLS